jgi:alkylation response protein AidB-like acyl-CoA dehydrogenase
MHNLPQERLSIAVGAVAASERVLALTAEYVTSRTAFGRPVSTFQNTRFVMAELQTEATIARTFVDECIRQLNAGDLTVTDAAMAKWWTTELQNKVADRCLQLHGGYGYMDEYPVSKAWRDSRVQSIYGGTNEIMKEIIGRSMGL